MTDRDEFDRDRMRREEDDYRAVTERPPQALGAILTTRYTCGCEASGALVSRSCPMHGDPEIAGPPDTPLYPHRSVADRRADVIRVLTEHPDYSDRRLSRIAVVSRELVTTIRRELIRTSVIPSRHALHRIGADGKSYTRLPRAKEATP